MAGMQDIANKVGVSRNTVSKVLNNKGGVSGKLRNRILAMAKECGYFKTAGPLSLAAEALDLQGKSVSLMVTNPEVSQYWVNIINDIARESQNKGLNLLYQFIYCDTDGKPIFPKQLDTDNMLGIIAMNIYDEAIIQEIRRYEMPVVYYDTPVLVTPEMAHGDVIYFEGWHSIYQITEHLLGRGITRLGFIGDITYSRSIYDRWIGFRAALEHAGLSPDLSCCCLEGSINHFYASGEVEKSLEKISKLPEAFVCANDVMAHRAIQYYKQRGLQVGRDFLVSGYDNTTEFIALENNMTSVDTDVGYLRRRFVNQLIYRASHSEAPFETVLLQSRPIFRSSTEGRILSEKVAAIGQNEQGGF